MTRLINADALIDKYQNGYSVDVFRYEVIEDLCNAPTIEAIPVDFIRGEIARMNQGANRYLSECATYAEDLENLIMEWERWGK